MPTDHMAPQLEETIAQLLAQAANAYASRHRGESDWRTWLTETLTVIASGVAMLLEQHKAAQASALQPGQVAVEEADLRWLVVREAESGNGGCYETCPARAQCPVDEGENAVITSGCCRAMLLAHFGLAANEEAPA